MSSSFRIALPHHAVQQYITLVTKMRLSSFKVRPCDVAYSNTIAYKMKLQLGDERKGGVVSNKDLGERKRRRLYMVLLIFHSGSTHNKIKGEHSL